jgi:hypothetical protein
MHLKQNPQCFDFENPIAAQGSPRDPVAALKCFQQAFADFAPLIWEFDNQLWGIVIESMTIGDCAVPNMCNKPTK